MGYDFNDAASAGMRTGINLDELAAWGEQGLNGNPGDGFIGSPGEDGRTENEKNKGLAREAIEKYYSELCDALLARGASAKNELAKQLGEGIITDLYMYTMDSDGLVPETAYTKAIDPLRFRGITVIAARTGGGKTQMLCSLAAYLTAVMKHDHVEDGHPREGSRPLYAVVITMEEPSSVVYARLLANYMCYRDGAVSCRIRDIERVQRGELNDDYVKPLVERHEAEMDKHVVVIGQSDIRAFGKAPFQVTGESFDKIRTGLPNGQIMLRECADLCATVRILRKRLSEKGFRPVFFIDYVQRIENSDLKSSDRLCIVRSFMSELIDMKESEGLIAFTASQMNRELARDVGNDKPSEFFRALPEHMREAADVENAADTILYAMRWQDSSNEKNRMLLLRTLKSREGSDRWYAAAPIQWESNTPQLNCLGVPPIVPKSGTKSAPHRPAENAKSGNGSEQGSLFGGKQRFKK